MQVQIVEFEVQGVSAGAYAEHSEAVAPAFAEPRALTGRGPIGHDRGMTVVDARGLRCPMPLAMAKARMSGLAPGETLLVLATDPEAPIDVGAWASDEGHGFAHERAEGWLELRVRKRA